jgi:hypothetical protein
VDDAALWPDQTGAAGAWRILEGDAAPVLAAAPLIDGFSLQLMGMRRDCSKLR